MNRRGLLSFLGLAALAGPVRVQAAGDIYVADGRRPPPVCAHSFCDSRCGLKASNYTYAGVITGTPDPYTVEIGGPAAGQNEDFFVYGILSFASGESAGLWTEIYRSDGSTIKTFLAIPREACVGDTVSVVRGCRKREADCRAYGNFDRFVGVPSHA